MSSAVGGPTGLSADDATRLAGLEAVVRGYESTVTAFSAGVDSTLVAVVAQRALGDRALAVTARSESLAPSELADAIHLARALGLHHRVVETHELADDSYASNPTDRCYFCKHHLYERLRPIALERGARHVLNGLNADDVGDWRPGTRAAAEHGDLVRSPLLEAGMGKAAIRALARALGLPNWDKPALACLASRLPYGERVTAEKLARVAEAEAALRGLGFRQLRVRHFSDRARVEIAPEELGRVAEEGLAPAIEAALLAAGFEAVEIDPGGYRSGRLNDGLVPLHVVVPLAG